MTHTLSHPSRQEALAYICRNVAKQCGCGKKTTWSCKKGSGLDHTHGIEEMGWDNGKPTGYVVVDNTERLLPYAVRQRQDVPHCPLPRKIDGNWRTLELEVGFRYWAADNNWYTAWHPLG